MKLSLMQRLLVLTSLERWCVAVTFSVLGTEFLVCSMELLLKGVLTYDYPLTGLVASLCVSTLVVSAMNLFIKEQQRIMARLQDSSQRIKSQAQQLLEKHENLLSQEAHYVGILEASPVPFAINDAEQNILLLNSAFVQTFGYTLDDIPTLDDWWPKAYPDLEYRHWVATTWQAHLSQADVQRRPFEPMEISVRCKNGSFKTVLVTAAVLGESYKTTHLVVLYDITERKRIEQALHLRNAELLHYFEQPLIGMLTSRHDKKMLHVNQRFCDMVGYSKAELASIDWSQLTHPQDLAASQAYFNQALRGDINNFQLEKRYIHKNGGEVYVHLIVNCVRNLQGKIDYFIAMALDISERKRSEAKLQESDQRFRDLFVNTPVAYQSLDQEGRYLDVNNPLCALLGYAREALLGRSFGDFWSPATQDKFKEAFTCLTLKGKANTELQLCRADGEEITVLLEGRVQTDMYGKFVRTHCVLFNITERKHIEDALNQSNTDLEQFAYSVSHDMRQPLRAVSSHVQLLQRSLANGLDEETLASMQFVLEGTKRMDAMISSLLEYSRIGRKDVQKTSLPTRASLDEALTFLKPSLDESHISVTVTGIFPKLNANHTELVRLFLNLLSNAIKYRTPNHPPVIAITASITAQRHWQVRIQDWGIGVDMQHAGRLFQFFSRLHSQRDYEGTGMGLALCKRIVEQQGGKIWLESEGLDKGCCVIFTLPLKSRKNALL